MTGPALLIIGVVALFAAIVGGGIKIKEIEVGTVPSLWRQGLLAVFGVIVALTGLVLMDSDSSANTAATQNVAAVDENLTPPSVEENAIDANGAVDATDPNATDANATDDTASDQNSADSGSSETQ